MQLLKKKQRQLIGLDIGSRYIKAVLLDIKNDSVTVQACAREALPQNTIVERDIKDADAFSTALRKLKLALKVKKGDVAAAVSGSSVITKVVYMDEGMSDLELETQIELEADSLIPYPLEQVYLDFEDIGPSQSAEDKIDVLLTAAHRDLVDTRVTLFREVEFEPKVIDVEGYAFARAVQAFAQPVAVTQGAATEEELAPASAAAAPGAEAPVADADQAPVIVAANIGFQVMTLVAVQGEKVLYCKDHQFGADVLLQDVAIMNTLDKAEAERQMLSNELPDTWQQDSLAPYLTNLSQQLSRATQQLASNQPGVSVERLLISGGAACIPGLVEGLAEEMSVAIELFNPVAQFERSEQAAKSNLDQSGAQFVLATGLAYRGTSPWHI